MIEIVRETLENEMDLVLAHKKAMRLAELLELTLTTQTVFATAISEISREIIEKTNTGILTLGLISEEGKYSLQATILCGGEDCYDSEDEGFRYAKKLVTHYEEYVNGNNKLINLQIKLPALVKITPTGIEKFIYYFEHLMPFSPYETIKRQISSITQKSEAQEEELRNSKSLDDKKNEFISLASHELKTPVTIIKAFAQLAKKSGPDNCSATVQTFISKIEDQASKLTSLIQQLLDVSKMERDTLDYKMDEASLNGYITETLSILQHTIPRQELKIKLGADVLVRLDKFRMKQVFSNLLGNASKYSAESTIITITTTSTIKEVVIAIKDEGMGMSEEDLVRVFDKFHRNKEVINKYSGLGMGLYISSRIIAGHGGRIWVKSELNKGSTFYFSIPLSS